jgi:vacuolar-type H+-ATPase subunit I/STV1
LKSSLEIALSVTGRAIGALAVAFGILFVARYDFYLELVRLGAISIVFYLGMVSAVLALIVAALLSARWPNFIRVLYSLTAAFAVIAYSKDVSAFYAIAMFAISLVGLVQVETRRATLDRTIREA